MKKIDPETIAADWAVRGFTCDLWVDPPGQKWEDFLHEFDELVLVLEGKVELEIEGMLYRPNLGEEVYIPAGAVHSTRNVGETVARWLYGYKANGGQESIH